ncbi:MAG TPA: hypothetical protein VIC84_04865 [Blastocatellia bacterium]|jgi:hypothetical protein
MKKIRGPIYELPNETIARLCEAVAPESAEMSVLLAVEMLKGARSLVASATAGDDRKKIVRCIQLAIELIDAMGDANA